jgi:hypothetical protein
MIRIMTADHSDEHSHPQGHELASNLQYAAERKRCMINEAGVHIPMRHGWRCVPHLTPFALPFTQCVHNTGERAPSASP